MTKQGIEGNIYAEVGMSRRGERLGHVADMAVNLLIASASRRESCSVFGGGDCKLIVGRGWTAEAR